MTPVNTVDQSFVRIRKNVSSLIIWKIQNSEIFLVPTDQHGKFCSKDAYLLFTSSECGKLTYVEEKSYQILGKAEIHIHSWLGLESSQDDAVIAAFKAVELDTFIGGGPVLHREVQGGESNRFLSYFRTGIMYLQDKLLLNMYPKQEDLLGKFYHISGTRSYVAEEITEISWDNISDEQVYVLDLVEYLFVWIGRFSSDGVKILGSKFAADRTKANRKAVVVIVEGGQEMKLTDVEKRAFEKYLPLGSKQLNRSAVITASIANRNRTSIRHANELKLYRCIEEDGTIKILEVKSTPFCQSDLMSNGVFLIDDGIYGIWMWIGRNISYTDRSEAIRNAQGFISKKDHPAGTPITRVLEGSEPSEFKCLFLHWRDSQSIGYKALLIAKIASTTIIQTKYNAEFLFKTPLLAAHSQMVDDGLGEKEIWRVRNFQLEKIPEDYCGELFMDECYVTLYAYKSNKSNYILYYWFGSKSTIEDRLTTMDKVTELSGRLDGKAVEVRIHQGMEPPHFVALFQGRMIVYKACKTEEDCTKSVYMMEVHGSSRQSTRAYEVNLLSSSLNANHCFILSTPCQTFVWSGKRSTGDQREVAKNLAKSRGDVMLISEGREPAEFCHIFGGFLQIGSQKPTEEPYRHEARLFQCKLTPTGLAAEEILDFNQNDLVEDTVMMLDIWDAIYIWIGRRVSYDEKENIHKIADQYLKVDPARRCRDLPVYKISQENEPATFFGFFIHWDQNLFSDYCQNSNVCTKIEEHCSQAKLYLTPTGQRHNGQRPVRTFPMSTLFVHDPSDLPESVNPELKEEYLCDIDFQTIFNMDKDTYSNLPKWRKTVLKKKIGLF